MVVYSYRVYDAREDDYSISTRMATRAKIKQIGGEIVPGTKTEIDDKHLREGGRRRALSSALRRTRRVTLVYEARPPQPTLVSPKLRD
jgi:hypothetical protein